jgi:hypothetical protein
VRGAASIDDLPGTKFSTELERSGSIEVAAHSRSALSPAATPGGSSTPVEESVEARKSLLNGLIFIHNVSAGRIEVASAWCYARHLPYAPDDARGRVEHPAETRAEDVWTPVAGWLRDTLTESTYDTRLRAFDFASLSSACQAGASEKRRRVPTSYVSAVRSQTPLVVGGQ